MKRAKSLLSPGEVTGASEVTDARAAVEACYREHGSRLWSALVLFTGDSEVASDAVAEAFAQALRRGNEVKQMDRWVYKAAFRLARGELARRRRTAHPLPDIAVEMPPPTVDLVRALATLSPKQRAAVILHHHAGYSNIEVAEIIRSTPGAVGTHLERARARLREALGDDDEP